MQLNSENHKHRSLPVCISFAKHIGVSAEAWCKAQAWEESAWRHLRHSPARFSGWTIYSFIWRTFSCTSGVSMSECSDPLGSCDLAATAATGNSTLVTLEASSGWIFCVEPLWEAPLGIVICKVQMEQNHWFLNRGTQNGPGLRPVSPSPFCLKAIPSKDESAPGLQRSKNRSKKKAREEMREKMSTLFLPLI